MPARPTLAFGPFTFDRHNRMLRTGEREIALPPRVLGVLELLIARAGEVVPRQDLIDGVWKEAFVTDTSLAEAVSVLRQALGDDPQAPTYIQTVHRRGYRFVAPIDEIAPPAAIAGPIPPHDTARAVVSNAIVSPSIGGQLVPWSVATICVLIALAALWRATHQQTQVPRIVRLRIDPAAGTSFDPRAPSIALAPDGSKVVWSACDRSGCRLYVRELERLDAQAIPGTDDACAPFFSPDSAWVGFFASGKLKKVALAGGIPLPLTDASQAYGGAWLPNGRIVFAASAYGGLMRVSDRGGEATPLTSPSARSGEIRHAWPSLLPGGRSLVFSIATSPLDGAPGRIAVARIDGDGRVSWQTLLDAADRAQAVTADYLAFSRGGELHAVPIDTTRMTVAGAEQVVAAGLAPAQFAVTDAGALAYVSAGSIGREPPLAWSSSSVRPPSAAAALKMPALSPNGLRIAGLGGEMSGADVWVADLDRGATVRLTHGGVNALPVWMSDAAVVYAAAKNGPFELWTRDASASAAARLLLPAAERDRHAFPSSASGDGTLIAYVESGGPTRSDIWIMPSAGGPATAAVQTPFDEINGMLSPDGRLVAYQSDESGRWEIALLRLSDKRRVAVSTGGGVQPRWSPDGRSLFYRAGADLVRVDVDPAGDRVGPVSIIRPLAGATLAGIAPDGRLLLRADDITPSISAILTLEWKSELRQRLGPPAMPLPR